MFKVLFFLSIVFFQSIVHAKFNKYDCLHKRNKICHKIVTLNPQIDHKFAYKLSNQFLRASKKYNLSKDLLISIAFQESSFQQDIIREVTGLIKEGKSFKKVRVGTDFCLMQIHISNIKKLNLDTEKLLTDSKYCIDAGAKILSHYKNKYYKREKLWWTRYNALSSAKRDIYYNKVSRHLKKLNTDFAKRNIASH